MPLSFTPVWFDSLGAKSSCTLVETPDVSILIDPGVAIMQPSFPASEAKKLYWLEKGRREVKKAARKADVIVISHYHYDHYFPEDMHVYEGKLLLAKNPNEYINDSQRGRAEEFYSNICARFGDGEIVLKEPERKSYPDPLKLIPLASRKNFGSYEKRRNQLLKKGARWFENRVRKWNSYPRIPEMKFPGLEVRYPEGKEFTFGKTKLRFTRPLFHGVEFSRVGWVFATVVEYGGKKFIHSSDMNGPIIEDHAEWIVRENPQVLVLDGPMTYMFGYLLNRTNLNRAIKNSARIVKKIDAEVIIYDHHLTREPRFKENTKEVWDTAKKLNKNLVTAAEYLGKVPKVIEVKK